MRGTGYILEQNLVGEIQTLPHVHVMDLQVQGMEKLFQNGQLMVTWNQ